MNIRRNVETIVMIRVKKIVAHRGNSEVEVLTTLMQLLNSCSEMSLEDSRAGAPGYVGPPTHSCFSHCLFRWVVFYQGAA